MDTISLAAAAAKGDRDAFCELYSAYSDKLYKYALYKLRNEQDAQDAVSDAIVSAFKQICNLKKPEAFASWIFKILNAACTKYISDQARQRYTENIDDSAVAAGLYSPFNSTSLELDEAMSILSDEEKSIVLLYAAAGLNSKEISKVTGLTPGAVRSKLSRSLAKMRKFWSDAK